MSSRDLVTRVESLGGTTFAYCDFPGLEEALAQFMGGGDDARKVASMVATQSASLCAAARADLVTRSGGGIKGGVTAGESDQWGYKPLDRANPTTCYDIHATMMHLLGIDHEKLTVRHNGLDRRLTDVHGHVIKDILA